MKRSILAVALVLAFAGAMFAQTTTPACNHPVGGFHGGFHGGFNRFAFGGFNRFAFAPPVIVAAPQVVPQVAFGGAGFGYAPQFAAQAPCPCQQQQQVVVPQQVPQLAFGAGGGCPQAAFGGAGFGYGGFNSGFAAGGLGGVGLLGQTGILGNVFQAVIGGGFGNGFGRARFRFRHR